MRAMFDDSAVVDRKDHIRRANRGQPVGNGDRGAVLHQGLQRRLHETFVRGVQG